MNTETNQTEANSLKKQPSMLDALIPLVFLMIMLGISVYFYGSDSSYGANQIALILAAAVASLIGFKNGYTWDEIETGIKKGVSTAYGAILILMMVGSLIGSWIISGTVPTMVYFGLQVLDPSIFYAAACLICAVVSISIGSSWTTAGTVGVALIGIAAGLDMSMGITAGAIISGAYFGDKMSPLSDTTNLAPAVAGTDLFTHIRHMMWTTGPSILIALIIFTVIGFSQDYSDEPASLGNTLTVLDEQFNISWVALIPLLVVLVLAFKKVPAFLTLLIGSLFGCVFAIIFQPQVLERSIEAYRYDCSPMVSTQNFSQCSVNSVKTLDSKNLLNVSLTLKNNSTKDVVLEILDPKMDQSLVAMIDGKDYKLNFEPHSDWHNTLDAVWRALYGGYVSESGDEGVDDLLSRGGMWSMMNTIWLILTALTFGAVLETIGLLQRIVNSVLSLVKGTGSLITAVVTTCIGTNLMAGDQYIAIVLPGRMYRAEFARRGLDAKNLSRSLEDSATMTSVLIPWNTCGAYMAATLGVPTLVYLPFCFFNIASPFISIAYGIANFKIAKIENSDKVSA